MELAIQLMPNNVPEFLDNVQEILADEDTQPEALPEYNFSTVVILKQEAS